LKAQRLDRAHPLGHLFEVFLLGAPPGSAHAKARGSVLLRRSCRREHRLERNERLVFDPGAVARRLRAVGTILGAPSSLDREQCGELHRVGIEVQAMDGLGAIEKIVERQLEERLDGFPSPAAAVCGSCLNHPPHFDATLALWRYEFPCDRLVQALKYRARLALAGFFARNLASRPLPEVDLIVPMPLHPKRLAERGFNQALEIARGVARHLGRPIEPRGVLRVKDTPPQTELP